jgi:5-methylcytosine-specific restriction protein A
MKKIMGKEDGCNDMPYLFCNVGWMKFYHGVSDDDPIAGGGEYVAENASGCEMYNFQEYQGKVYGYVATGHVLGKIKPVKKSEENAANKRRTIRIERLGASNHDPHIDNVTVIWTAPHPAGSTYIVGWYRHATVFRTHQTAEALSYRMRNDVYVYNVVAQFADTKLLPVEERTFEIPRGTGGMGQCNVWYANSDFIEKVKQYIS